MSVLLSAYQIALAGAVVTSLFVAGVGWYYRGVPGARPLVVLVLAVAWWSLTSLVELVTTGEGVVMLASTLSYLGIVLVPVAWLVFAVQYTGRLRVPTRRELAGLLVVPAVVVVLVWTNDYHGLIWTSREVADYGSHVVTTGSYGPGFWAWTAYAYVLLAVGTGLVLVTALFSRRLYRDQAIGLVVAVVLPWLGNAVYISGLTESVDLSTLGFAVSGLVLTGVIFRRQFLAVVPVAREVARDAIMDSMSEAVVVVDGSGRVVDFNPSASEIVDGSEGAIVGEPLADVLAPLADLQASVGDAPHRSEVTVSVAGTERTFGARVTPLDRGGSTITGHLLTLRDVTERRERERRIERQRQRLEVVNRVLRHDIRNDMNVIMGHAAEIDPSPDDERHVTKIKQTSEHVVELSRKARDIEALTADESLEVGVVDVVEIVERIVDDLEAASPGADCRVRAPTRAHGQATPRIEAAISNVVGNALEHNDRATPSVTVTVRRDSETVDIEVADDGPGLPDQEQAVIETGRETALRHSSGLGLWLVYWIVTQSGGEVTFSENDPRGSIITISLPRAHAADAGTDTVDD